MVIHYKQANAGHFDHNHNSTYFREDNTHLQCVPCNFGGLGQQYEYGLFLDQTYGAGRSKEILAAGKKEKIFYQKELREMNETYKQRIKEYEALL
jgi:hypothetical protein